jgi:hypothetical protein
MYPRDRKELQENKGLQENEEHKESKVPRELYLGLIQVSIRKIYKKVKLVMFRKKVL